MALFGRKRDAEISDDTDFGDGKIISNKGVLQLHLR